MTMHGGWHLGDRGSTLIELAVSLPILVLILVATVDFARVFYMGIELTNAARAGAQFGAASLARSGDTAGMQTAAQNSGNLPGISATGFRVCQCADNSGVFSATSPANTCTGTCTTGHLVVTVTVTTSKVFNTIFTGFPALPSSVTLERTATLRVVN